MVAYGFGGFERDTVLEGDMPPHVEITPWFMDAEQRRLHDNLTKLLRLRRNIECRVVDGNGEGLIVPGNHTHPLNLLHCGVIGAVDRARGRFADEDIRRISYSYQRPIHAENGDNQLVPAVFIVDHFALIGRQGDQNVVQQVYRINGHGEA